MVLTQLLSSPLEIFLPENVFLLLQSVVVSFIIHILAQPSGFPDLSRPNWKKWSSWPSCGSHQSLIWTMKLINVPFFSYFLSTLPYIYTAWKIFFNKLLIKYLMTCFGSFILSGELNGDVKGTACNNKSVLQMACQEKDTESLKSLQTELWWVNRGNHVYLKSWHCSSTFSTASLSKMFVLIMYLSSVQAFSECWAESPSPPGGTRAHYTVGTRRLVQLSCNSLPVRNCSF